MSRALYRDTGVWPDFGAFAHAAAMAETGAPLHPLLAAASGSNQAVPSDGGFLVPDRFAGELWERVTAQGRILSRVTPQPMTGAKLKVPAVDETSRADGSRQGGVRGYWANEAGTVTSSRPKFRALELQPRKVLCFAYATDELLGDSAGLGPWLERVLTNELIFQVEASIVAGDGAAKPLGYLSAPAAIEVAPELGQASNTLVGQNLAAMLARTWIGSRGNLTWVIHPDHEGALLSITSAGGVPLFSYSDDGTPRLLGRPVIPIEYAPAPGQRGDIQLVDLSQYLISERPLDFAPSMHLRFLQDEGVFRLSLRIDGQPAWHSPVTPYKGATTQSPFVVLAPRP